MTSLSGLSQVTRVQGTVVDDATGETIPAANIVFKGTRSMGIEPRYDSTYSSQKNIV